MRIEKLSAKQKRLMKWAFTPSTREKYKAVVCDGSVRSGKTICMVTAFILWAMRNFDGHNLGICGKTVASAERNIVIPAQEVEDLTAFFRLYYRKSDHVLVVSGNGRENRFYIFGGKDESSYALIQGITLAGILFDEVALMPQSFVDQGIARTLSIPESKLWFNCNPESPGHWFYREWIQQPEKKQVLHLHFRMEDNPIMTPRAIADAEAMYTGVFYQRYILGLWVAAEGRIYDCFDTDRNTVYQLPETTGSYYVSCDYGTQNATVFLLWQRERNSERWVCLREYYYSGRDSKRQKTTGEFERDFTAWLGGITPRAVVIDPAGAPLITELRQAGYAVQPADNDVIAGIGAVANRLERGLLLFSTACTHTLEEFTAYVWDEKAAQYGEDKPVKVNDHCMDAVRYFVYTILGREVVKVRTRPRGM